MPWLESSSVSNFLFLESLAPFSSSVSGRVISITFSPAGPQKRALGVSAGRETTNVHSLDSSRPGLLQAALSAWDAARGTSKRLLPRSMLLSPALAVFTHQAGTSTSDE
eukprot:11209264-Lingulodinium_polyedra.AAC.2